MLLGLLEEFENRCHGREGIVLSKEEFKCQSFTVTYDSLKVTNRYNGKDTCSVKTRYSTRYVEYEGENAYCE